MFVLRDCVVGCLIARSIECVIACVSVCGWWLCLVWFGVRLCWRVMGCVVLFDAVAMVCGVWGGCVWLCEWYVTGEVRVGVVSCLFRFGVACCVPGWDWCRCGVAWLGLAWLGVARFGVVWVCVIFVLVRIGLVCVGCDVFRVDVWCDVWCDGCGVLCVSCVVSFGLVWFGVFAWCGLLACVCVRE